MSYFDEKNNALEYIKMAEGYDGRELILVLKKYLPNGSSLLELGMGPGKDLDLLNKYYTVTGSDNSHPFLDLYRKEHPDADLLYLDARTLETSLKFDGIYSNKVLIHLSEDELRQSFNTQKDILNPGGIILHSFWQGAKEEFFHGLRFRYTTESELLEIIEPIYEVLEMKRYTEIEKDDSFFILLKKPSFDDKTVR